MIEGLKPYAEYKESGLPWLGRVPAHWRTPRLKTVIREKEARSLDGAGLLLSLTRNRGLIARSDMTEKIHSARTLAGYKLYEPGEIVMNRMQAWSGMFGSGNKAGLVSPDYAVFKLFSEEHVDFLLARIKAPDLVSQFALESKGIGSGFNRLYSDRFGAISISLPPTEEQAAIVRFLDHANRKIDGFIRAKRKLIGLLNEQKQAIIQTAVSKVSAQDCQTMPVRAVLRPVKRLGFPDKTLLSLFREFGVIPKDSRENKNVDVRDLALCQLVTPGDVVMNKMKAWQGSIAVSGLEGIVSPDYMVLEFQIEPIVKNFFHYVLRSPGMVANYRKQAYGVRPGQWRLMYPDFCRLRLPVPSVNDQQAIVDHIRSATQGINTAIARTEREITLMQEYRTRLTADIVTGKLDVREAAAKLPAAPAAEPLTDETPGDSDMLDEIEAEES